MFGDCYAASHFISPRTFEEFALEPAQRVIEAYRKMGAVVIVHNSEESPAFLSLLADLGADVLNFGPGIGLGLVRERIGQCVCISGNVDPIHTLANGTVQQIEQETRSCFDQVGHAGYIFNTGECVPRHTPEANIQAMIRAARQAGQRGV